MRLLYTERFRRSYASAPPHIQTRCDKQLGLLVQNLRHPSLRAKKYDDTRDIAFDEEACVPTCDNIYQ